MIGFGLLFTQARALNLMMIGERDAFALSVEPARTRWLVFAAASLLTGTFAPQELPTGAFTALLGAPLLIYLLLKHR